MPPFYLYFTEKAPKDTPSPEEYSIPIFLNLKRLAPHVASFGEIGNESRTRRSSM
jgi:hypothetical protein